MDQKKDEKSLNSVTVGKVRVQVEKNGSISYFQNGQGIISFTAEAKDRSGRILTSEEKVPSKIRTLNISDEIGSGKMLELTFLENSLTLIQKIYLYEGRTFLAVQAELTSGEAEVETNHIVPVVTGWPGKNAHPSLQRNSLWMLLVPYDNDMWSRYELAPLRSGRTSYDVTVLCGREAHDGLLIGAVDFGCWKNGILCSSTRAKVLKAVSGVADAGTHDVIPHGTIKGKTVSSARFLVGWYDDMRDGLEEYARACSSVHPPMRWPSGTPFGYNAYSGLGSEASDETFRAAGDFIHTLGDFHDQNGVTYINLDGGWQKMTHEKAIREYIGELHARGQKAGCYDAPFVAEGKPDTPLPGVPGKTYGDIFLRNPDGSLAPRVDNFIALDVSHPLWEQSMRYRLKSWIDMGFDYLKIDFLPSGALEGAHSDPAVRTGRQAYSKAMRIMDDAISRKNAGRDFFLSLSIAPIFPHGYGHARRFCCDSFAYRSDVEYVLNAQTFAWWQSGPIYSMNDPDHIVLYQSSVMHLPKDRPSTLAEARARYTTGVIAGSVMLLSDHYGPGKDTGRYEESKKRARILTGNREVNDLARKGKPFRPLSLNCESCRVFSLTDGGSVYLALFNVTNREQSFAVCPKQVSAAENGLGTELWTRQDFSYHKTIARTLAAGDAEILKIPAANRKQGMI